MHLSWYGGQTDSISASKTCSVVAYGAIVYFIIICLIASLQADILANSSGYLPPLYLFLEVLRYLVNIVFVVYMIVAIAKTRRYIREKYSIREKYCRGCEDCMCAYCCPCLTIAQMARHTADYDTYNARACTSTGLPPNAPEIV